jgi:hypothetical protein
LSGTRASDSNDPKTRLLVLMPIWLIWAIKKPNCSRNLVPSIHSRENALNIQTYGGIWRTDKIICFPGYVNENNFFMFTLWIQGSLLWFWGTGGCLFMSGHNFWLLKWSSHLCKDSNLRPQTRHPRIMHLEKSFSSHWQSIYKAKFFKFKHDWSRQVSRTHDRKVRFCFKV